MAVTDPDVSAVPGHVDVPRADRHAGRRTSCATSGSAGEPPSEGIARAHPLRRRARAGRRAARRRGPGVRDRPDPPRRRPHPPRDAHHRPGAEGARHDVRAGAQPRRRRAACWPTSSSCRATSPTRTRSSSSSGCSCCTPRGRSTSTTTTSGSARTSPRSRSSMPTVLHDIAWRAMQVHGALGVSNEMPFCGMMHRRRRHGPRRRADRGAQGHRRPPGAARLPAERRPVADRSTSRSSWPRPGRSTPSTSSTRWGTCDRRRAARRVDGRARASPGKGEPLEHALRLRRHRRTRSTRSAAATSTARCGSRRRPRRPSRDDGHPPRVAHHRGARRHRRARTPRPSPCATDPSVLGRTFYLMGFVDGWSPMNDRRLAGAVRHRPRGPRRASPTSWSRASRCSSQGRLAGEGPRRTSAGPTASTSARSTGGPRSSSASRAASCPASTRRRPGCAPTSRSTTSPASCTATTSSPT